MDDILKSRFAGPRSPLNMQLGYFFLRAMIGGMLFSHGFMRVLTGLGAWEGPMAVTFEETYLPMPLVHGALYLIPLAELVIGTLTLLGLFTRWALLAGVALFCVLLYGHMVRQSWATGHVIVHYGVYYWLLFVFQKYNWLALDNLRTRTT